MSGERESKFREKLEEIIISRRSFLKWSGGLSALAACSQIPFINRFYSVSPAEALQLEKEAEWIYSCCNMCGGQTGIRVLVKDGIVKKIEPNDFNPIGVANISLDFEKEMARGARLCPKGNAGIKSLYDPDRLKAPLKRTGKRGEGRWEAISWDEAIDLAASRLGQIRDRWGPETLVWFSEDHSFVHIQQDFCAAFGTPNYHNHSNLCDVARKASFKLTQGDERPLADMQNAKYIMLWGWNPLGAMKWAHLPAIINRGREKGAKLVVVDPIFSQTAAKADEWIPLRPGTDGALALAMGHTIVREGLYDEAFVKEWTVGFKEYADFVRDKIPQWAEKITTVPAATIERLAHEVAKTKPSCIDFWSGPGHHTNATLGGMAIAILPILLGQIDKPGTLINPEKKGSKHRANLPEWKLSGAPRLDGLGKKYPFGHKSGIYVETREAMIRGYPYQARAAVFVFQNFVMSVPNQKKNIEAIKKMEFVMAVDTHLSETAELADLVIPGTNYLERYDFNSNWVTFPSLGLRQPVVKSWIGGMTEAEFIMALARKMGFKGFDMSYEQYLSDELKAGIGITLEELKAKPGAVWVGGKTKYEKFRSEVKLPEGGSIDPETGVVKDKDGKALGLKIGDKLVKGFETPSRKLELFSKQLKEKGYSGLPEYHEPIDKPSKEYPLYLVNWKQAEHTHTRTFNNPWLMEMKPDNPLWINTDTAKKLGLEEGDLVWIESPYARAKGTVHLTEGIHPEVVGLQHGYGHWAMGKVAKGRGTADGQFLAGRAEILSGQAVHKEIGVKVYKA